MSPTRQWLISTDRPSASDQGGQDGVLKWYRLALGLGDPRDHRTSDMEHGTRYARRTLRLSTEGKKYRSAKKAIRSEDLRNLSPPCWSLLVDRVAVSPNQFCSGCWKSPPTNTAAIGAVVSHSSSQSLEPRGQRRRAQGLRYVHTGCRLESASCAATSAFVGRCTHADWCQPGNVSEASRSKAAFGMATPAWALGVRSGGNQGPPYGMGRPTPFPPVSQEHHWQLQQDGEPGDGTALEHVRTASSNASSTAADPQEFVSRQTRDDLST